MIELKEAVSIATKHIKDLFEHEEISNLGLEEVEYEHHENEWIITVGFSRPWDYPRNAFSAIQGQTQPNRSYKVVTINAVEGAVLSIKNRPVSE